MNSAKKLGIITNKDKIVVNENGKQIYQEYNGWETAQEEFYKFQSCL